MPDGQAIPSAARPISGGAPIVRLEGVTKRYPGVIANDRIDMEFHAGEVHVLLGENGAGKSTLVSMLSGLQQPDEGRILIDGDARPIASPAGALDIGISTVFQHSMLVPSLTLVENAVLGRAWWRRPDREGTAARMAAMAARIGVSLDPMALTGDLSLGERQQAEIVRALMRGARFLILDEATAMLTPHDAARLGQLMRRLASEGVAVVFITHKLNEAVEYGDRISVLRLGRKVGGIAPETLRQMDPQAATGEVVRLMFGTHDMASGAAARVDPATVDRAGDPVLEVLALYAGAAAVPLHNIEFKVWPGEVFGIAGIDGNGQKQLAEALAGQEPISDGRIRLDGAFVDRLSIGARRGKGLRYITDDRLGEGTVGSFSVAINLLLKEIGAAPYWVQGFEKPAEITENAREKIRAFDIRTPSAETPVGKLSGGNIQKVLLARELTGTARAVIFNKPTYGLDLANIAATRQRIRDTAEAGAAVVLISTELDELLDLSHRIAVMDRGHLAGIVANDDAARRKIGELMSGVGE
ncbi:MULTISPECIES: putative B6 ABC transporter ATP-binding protein [Actibacterium]|uniref:Simple sugar transport system ATP-binding protein n=1 Tax=Actibacterium naphthalenivorans TaxID=1614693 RepID=A0A840CH84_9RHOB|nr:MULTISPECIES: ABC transporter ATP-binding protein [Actibacterium]MBB4022848.1 simple sugar transport system ATP-binding protein [Actibacterium naphthalenivorans]